MVYWSRISTKIHTSLYGALKIELFGGSFLGLRLFMTLSLPIGKPLRTWTNRIRPFRWVKDSRVAVWTYTFSTKKWNLDVAFLKMQWTDSWIAECLVFFICSVTENFPLLTLIGPCEIRSLLTPITAKSNSTILARSTRENKLQGLKKPPGIPDLSNANSCPCSACSTSLFSLFARCSREPRFGVGVSLPVSHAEIYRNWAIGITFYNMLQEARKRKSRGRTSMRASKRTLQASVLSVHCPQMKTDRGTKCAFILIVVRPTVAQRLFHTEFLSFIRFSPLRLLWRRKRTRNFLAFLSGH